MGCKFFIGKVLLLAIQHIFCTHLITQVYLINIFGLFPDQFHMLSFDEVKKSLFPFVSC